MRCLDYHHPGVHRGSDDAERVISAAVIDNNNLIDISWQAG